MRHASLQLSTILRKRWRHADATGQQRGRHEHFGARAWGGGGDSWGLWGGGAAEVTAVGEALEAIDANIDIVAALSPGSMNGGDGEGGEDGLDAIWGGSEVGSSLEADEEGPPQDMTQDEIAAVEARFGQMSFFAGLGRRPPGRPAAGADPRGGSLVGLLDSELEEPLEAAGDDGWD